MGIAITYSHSVLYDFILNYNKVFLKIYPFYPNRITKYYINLTSIKLKLAIIIIIRLY